MHTLLVTLHVVFVVFVIGPQVMWPMTGLRAIRTGDAKLTRLAARQTMAYAGASLLVFGFGVAAVPFESRKADPEYDFASPWLTISMTLYVIGVLLIVLLVAPALSKAAHLLAEPAISAEPAGKAVEKAAEPKPSLTKADAEDESDDDAEDTDSAGDAEADKPGDDEPKNEAEHRSEAGVERSGTGATSVAVLRSRVAAIGGIVSLLYLAIAVLMVTKPFGA